MRRALAAAGALGAVALSPVATQAAWAEPAAAPSVLAVDLEPASDDGDDDTAKYGLIGLTGMLGLFGYKKIKEHRAPRPAPRSTGTTTRASSPVGDDDSDSGSRRI